VLPGSPLADLSRSGNAGANTAADHITVLDTTFPAQIVDGHWCGTDVLVRTSSADGAKLS